ncbi:MAG: O-antigen ligase family protein [Clostridia bacterium]|nr:O-antigen ligase family protein [Clostridia bacterium]
MLTDAFLRLRDSRAVKLIRAFIRSPWYLAVNVLLMVIAELFSLELPVFYIYFLFIVVIFLFDEDLLGVMVLFPCHYLSISAVNNPGKNAETLFSDPSRMTQLVILICVYGVLFTARLISMLLLGGKRKSPELLFGFLFFAVALVAGGAFSGHWGSRTVTFGLVEIASLAAIYFFFRYAVNWKNVPKHYGMMLFLALGVGVAAQIVGMYFLPGAIVDSSVQRGQFYTGWGIYNNVGCIMAMCMPAPFYFAIKRKEGWIFSLTGIAFYLAVLLSQSRNAMLFGTVIFAICVVIVLIRAKGWERWKNLIAFGAFALVGLIAGLVFRERIENLYGAINEAGFNDAARFVTYEACWKRFLEAPWFGSGFYYTPGTVLQPDTDMWTTLDNATEVKGFLPPRAHNTLFQLLASGGIFMLLAYLVHRVETGILFFRHPTTEKTFISVCVLALLLTSLLDCHLFNFGPGLVYSTLLAFAEGDNLMRDKRSKFTLNDFKNLKIRRKKKE